MATTSYSNLRALRPEVGVARGGHQRPGSFSCTCLIAQARWLCSATRRGQPTTAHHPRPPDPPRGVTRRKGSPGVHGWPSGAKDRTTRPSRDPQLDPRAGRCCCSQLRRTRIAAQQHQASSPRAATGQSGAPGTSLGPWTPLEWPSGAGKGRAPFIVVLASVSVCLIKFPPF